MDELIVYLCLNLGWTFEYACKFVKETPIKKLNVFVTELQYQKAIEDYRIASNFATIVCTMASSKRQKYKVTDIIGQPPQRKQRLDKLKTAIKNAGIIMPEE